jgi:hypothetical protein
MSTTIFAAWGKAKPDTENMRGLNLTAVASGGQTRLGFSGQELRPWRVIRLSVAEKGVNREAEESTVLGAVTKQWLEKIQQTEKA